MDNKLYPPYDPCHTNPGTISVNYVKPCSDKNKCVRNSTYYVQILFSNLGICVLLIGYTFLGSFIFLTIEGRWGGDTRTFLTDRQTPPFVNDSRKTQSIPSWKQATDEFRARTVENIWEITAALNILYHDNWTRLASQEISRFQDELVQKLTEEILNSNRRNLLEKSHQTDWNFSRAFLYSLTILTTVGYGGLSPRTLLGKVITIIYAFIGIPLTLLYLSSVGSVLSRCARGVCSKALCCCLCSNCGYCCYDEKRMQEKERRMKRKRELEEMQQMQLQEPLYFHSSSSVAGFTKPLNPAPSFAEIKEIEEDWHLQSAGSILAPLGLCLLIMTTYIVLGSIMFVKLESLPFLDCCYFCFMSLSTIHLTDVIIFKENIKNTTVWLCSIYILTGLALTAMCFKILHEELLKRLKQQIINGLNAYKTPRSKKSSSVTDETGPDLYSSS